MNRLWNLKKYYEASTVPKQKLVGSIFLETFSVENGSVEPRVSVEEIFADK
jgi:hypothetical protein